MSAATQQAIQPNYFLPTPSRDPVLVAAGMLFIIAGGTDWINGGAWGVYSFVAGLLLWVFAVQHWFRRAIGETERGLYSLHVDTSFRWSMSWFIFTEVMFFGGFFGALFYLRVVGLPSLGSLDAGVLWPHFRAIWPQDVPGLTASPAGITEPFRTMGPWPIPTLNTALLLSSGVTITIAHHALIAGRRAKTIGFMWLTVLLGLTFLCFQAYEYHHAYTELNLKLTSGPYGSTFFMLTGFHGFHVFVGMMMLTFITIRLMKGHFTPQRHFGFEGAAWYWHFVDVVWLGLYFVVYWL